MVSRTNIRHTVRHENAFVQNNLSLDRRKIFAFYSEKLRRKGKNCKRSGNGGRFTTGKSIRKRDKSVYGRKEFGHWEADTVVSGQGKSKTCFATLAERKTRYYIAVKIPDRKGETMAKAIISALPGFPKETVKTITCDRGSEFSCRRDIEKALNCDMYSLIRIVHGKTIHHKICSLKISLTVALDLTIHPGVYVF